MFQQDMTRSWDQPLWLNSNIRIGNRPALYTAMLDQGFDKIKDIVDEEGAFIEWEVIKRKTGWSYGLY